MASSTPTASVRGDAARRRTPAQWYCVLAGAALLVAGVTGFLADASFHTGDGVQGSSLIGFEVNGWHNLVHVASGALLLAAASRRTSARTIALGFGVVYGAVAVYGLIDGADVIGLVPVNAADNLLHVALAATGILAGLASPLGEPLRTTTAPATRDTPAGPGGERAARFTREQDLEPFSGAPRDRDAPTH